MAEIQKFIQENGIEAFRELVKQQDRLELMNFRLEDKPKGWN